MTPHVNVLLMAFRFLQLLPLSYRMHHIDAENLYLFLILNFFFIQAFTLLKITDNGTG